MPSAATIDLTPAEPEDCDYPAAPAFEAPFRIGRAETRILADEAVCAEIKRSVAHAGGAVFHDIVEPILLATLIEASRGAAFSQYDLKEYGLRGNDLSMPASLPFCVLLARPALMEWLQSVFDCDPIAHVEGHLAQMIPGNSLRWHRDAGLGTRRLAMVLNLTTESYTGAHFQMRREATRKPLFGYHANRAGSLSVFRIGPDLRHRVTPLESGGPRNTFAAWARGPWTPSDLHRGFALPAWPILRPTSSDGEA
jgi:hypothetical protein